MELKEAIRRANRGGLAVFKPGYPTGRGEYMVLDAGRHGAMGSLWSDGFVLSAVPCGHDYNYRGGLYRISRARGKSREA